MKPVLAITSGDINGIGPEVALKALKNERIRHECRPLLFGAADGFLRTARRLGAQSLLARLTVIDTSPGGSLRQKPGELSAATGLAAGQAIESAVEFALAGKADGIVTAPVSKLALHLAGYHVPGQTELLQRLTGSRSVAMMLVSPAMRVGLVTIHVPVRSVARLLTAELLTTRIRVIHEALRHDWRIRNPRLAILALNPHAGEGGRIGTEEMRVILPVLDSLRAQSIRLEGPFPADAFFGRGTPGDYDAIVAMYHDQGLIPLKLSARGRAVNVSVGLPVVRTSPDHGTAFDIAGKGRADERSMIEAILLAAKLARNRRHAHRRTPR
jgi:4-hydroxythreonine-4-phosphate dehydrogenase